MSSLDMDRYADLFLDEMNEQLQMMDNELLQIEKNGVSETGIQNLFRAAHTLKGSAAAMGYEDVKTLTHEMEQVLDEIRHGRLDMNGQIIEVLFACLDHLQTVHDNLRAGDNTPVPIDNLVSRLRQTLNHAQDQPVERKEHDWRINIAIASSCEMKLARAYLIVHQLSEHARIVQCVPSPDQALDDAEYEHISIACRTSLTEKEIEQLLRSMMDVDQVEIAKADPPPSAPPSSEAGPNREKSAGGEPPAAKTRRKSVSSIRMNVEHLEQMMNLVGELVINQTRINQVQKNLQRKFQSDADVAELGAVSDQVNRVVADLQESMMKARMLPIEHLFNRFPRMVRDLSQNLNKEVELILEGYETELDRTLIEEIGDPLIHLIRNALDHGIESPEERIRKGKPAKGRLMIKAVHEDNQVVITVEDDGAGIDADKIRKSAVRKGLLTAEEAARLTDQDAIQLIFEAGFSTASEVSEISGRGVGMDIVRNDIERLNGLIDIRTKPGEGTQFIIRLPLTLAIITGLLVRIGEQTFILPMSNVAEILRIDAAEIQTVRGEEVIMNRDRVIPLVRLHERLRIETPPSARKKLPIVIVGSAEKRIALLVDDLIGNQDIVIKSLGSFLGKIDYISGATILGDGKVAPILEISDVFKYTGSIRP